MVGIELRDEIIALIAIVIVEEGEIAFLAPGTARPVLRMMVGTALRGGNDQASVEGEGSSSASHVSCGTSCASMARNVSATTSKGSDGALVTTMATRLPAGMRSGPVGRAAWKKIVMK